MVEEFSPIKTLKTILRDRIVHSGSNFTIVVTFLSQWECEYRLTAVGSDHLAVRPLDRDSALDVILIRYEAIAMIKIKEKTPSGKPTIT